VSKLKIGDVKKDMIEGFKGVVKDGWPQVKDFASVELKLLGQSLIEIEALAATGKIKKSEAKSLVRQHKNATIAVMAGIEGMSLLLAEQAVNAALKVAKDALNTAAGFVLL
jgi:hypothetical protein